MLATLPGGDRGAGVVLELGEDVFDVGFGRALGDDQIGGDLLAGLARGHKVGDPMFSVRQGRLRRVAGAGTFRLVSKPLRVLVGLREDGLDSGGRGPQPTRHLVDSGDQSGRRPGDVDDREQVTGVVSDRDAH